MRSKIEMENRFLYIIILSSIVLICLVLNWNPSSVNLRTPKLAKTQVVKSSSIVLLGDSYCSGAGSTNLINSWSSIFVARMGAHVINLCKGSTGFVSEGTGLSGCGVQFCGNYRFNLSQLGVSNTPDLIIISGGRNDFSMSTKTISIALKELIDYAQFKFQRSKIILISPFWDSTDFPRIGKELKLIEERVAVARGVIFINGAEDILKYRADAISRDGIHPNDLGHRLIAEWVLRQFAELKLAPITLTAVPN